MVRARRVRRRGGGHRRLGGADAVAAGPFTSGGAQIEAYYLLDCRDVAEAHDWARRLPTYGRVEVGPLLEYDLA